MKKGCAGQLIDSLSEDVRKLNKYLEIYERWIDLKNAGSGVCQFIRENGFERIAIYGAGRLGRSLCNDLKHEGIRPVYLIDQNKTVTYEDYPVYTLENELPEADVVIITPVRLYEEIAEMLEEKIFCPLLSLEDIIL